MSEKPRSLLLVIVLLCVFGILTIMEVLFFSRWSFFIRIIIGIVGIIQIISAIGLWSLNRLALKVIRALLMALLIISLFSVQILSFIIYGLMFWYLFKPEIKSIFKE